ncbi:TniQ family protein [Microcoleus sp. FACHB-1515]|uniref:TniQ family protein n=1 Tax=Cyanophyceae TaxID=3028117 RepID=UPI00168301CE|nr:TniQ family protein [Microcoleus sp. FACHB-1515]MBD2093433.1 TniQ family protein [Microcoleus sp. FACHB-1515]
MLLEDDRDDTTPWFNVVEPKDGESIASFLLRFRHAKANRISSATRLGELVGADTPVHCWEKLFFSPKPTQKQLEALSRVTRVEVDRLRQMFPAQTEQSRPYPIRICAACCQEDAYHRLAWQFIPVKGCNQHGIDLLMKCPNCKESFSIFGLLEEAKGCRNCGMRFKSMVKNRKASRQN